MHFPLDGGMGEGGKERGERREKSLGVRKFSRLFIIFRGFFSLCNRLIVENLQEKRQEINGDGMACIMQIWIKQKWTILQLLCQKKCKKK